MFRSALIWPATGTLWPVTGLVFPETWAQHGSGLAADTPTELRRRRMAETPADHNQDAEQCWNPNNTQPR
jgi:hypothetical protein